MCILQTICARDCSVERDALTQQNRNNEYLTQQKGNKTLNILFINPPNIPFSSKGILIEPIDLLTVANYAEQLEFSASALDMDVNHISSKDLSRLSLGGVDLAIIVCDYHIPLHNKGAFDQLKEISSFFKAKNAKVAIAGKSATFDNGAHLAKIGADLYIQHDIEPFLESFKTVLDLNQPSKLKNVRYLVKDILFETPRQPFDMRNIQAFKRDFLDLTQYIDVRTILSSRGCNLKCSFCHVPGFWGSWQGRTAQSVVDELLMLENRYNAKKVLFLDDNATANKRHMQEITSLLSTKTHNLRLGCLSSVLSYSEDLFKQMYCAGFRWVHFGAESADDKLLKEMHKAINFDKTIAAVRGAKRIGFRVRTSWILDMPNSTEEGLMTTLKAIEELETPEIRLHYLTLRLGSELNKEYSQVTEQFIHNSSQNLNISGVSDMFIQHNVEALLSRLVVKGYTVVRNAEDFLKIEELKKVNPELKIVSLCPLRYGLNWE